MSPLSPLPHAERSGPRERIAYLDNARFWVMLLVVIGHFLTDLVVMDSARGLYTWIYLFHMPFFVLISGYTARHYVGDFRQVRRIVSTLIVPYLIVETALQLMTWHYDRDPERLMILSPQWVGWFLAALFVWRLTTPIWRALKYPITTSIIISLAAGMIEIPNTLALHKVLGFLPFYVIGLHFNRELFLRLTTLKYRVIGAALLLGSLVFCLAFASHLTVMSRWLLWRVRYDELGVSLVEGVLVRGLLIAAGLVLALSALALVPRAKSWTTDLGSRTLYAYLLHGFVIIWLDRQFGLWAAIEPYGAVAVLGCVAVGAVLAIVLMTKPVGTLFRPIFEPKLTWMFRDPSQDVHHPQSDVPVWKQPRDPRDEPPQPPLMRVIR
ncbi:acyltransferase family protein [Aeromicrobium sp. YIM 150415]|uniref:acyltransferase family protein n=1 Tax=Aeromicrobium sp. YIM 150415 TaxID=2803912 RepID=UPI0019654D76|nr:acyltransferase family protein [Aeromicrobium sp. YIM 150415]MBM9465571.1 acyltransferase family protein [Aeromicrobium sp. YIM 150415]